MAGAGTVWELVEYAATERPGAVVLQDEHGRALTTVALRDAAERTAAGLHIVAGEVVSWQLPTSLEAAVLMLALARTGAVQNPIIPILRDADVRYITGVTGTTRLLVAKQWRGFDHEAMARSISHGFEVVPIDLAADPSNGLRLPQGDPKTLEPAPTDASAARWLYFTSGTTAAPKGVRHSDATLIASSTGMVERVGIGVGDVYPIAWPISHVGGITMLATVLRSGGTLVLFESFDPQTIAERMAAFRPTILGTGVPFFRAYLDGQARHGDMPLFPELRAFVAGGAPTPRELVRELESVFGTNGVLNAYGLTEFPIATSPAPTDPHDMLTNTIGRASPGVEVRVVDGELRLSGPQQFLGYVDATMDAGALDEAGRFRTGDLGSVDAEGYVEITGRLKDVIIRNGENISATEVEDVLLRHPGVLDVAVIGLPDNRTGERVCAVVVTAPNERVELESLVAHCVAEGLPKQRAPEELQIVDTIARNAMNKVLKDDLRAQVAPGAEEARPAIQDESKE